MSYDIAKKIHQLVAKAESTKHEAEAEAIMVKVRDLLNLHGLSLLTIATSLSDDPVLVQENAGAYFKSEGWGRRLSLAVAQYYGVKLIWSRKASSPNKINFTIAGRESCRAAFCAMMPYLQREVRRQARIADNAYHYTSFSRACTAIGNGLTYRLLTLAEKNVATTPRQQSGLNALVPVDIIQNVIDTHFGKGGVVESRQRTLKVNWIDVEIANGINLGDQIKGDTEGTLALGNK